MEDFEPDVYEVHGESEAAEAAWLATLPWWRRLAERLRERAWDLVVRWRHRNDECPF